MVREATIMPKFIIFGVVGILLGGCAGSSPDSLNQGAADSASHEARAVASTDLLSAEAERLDHFPSGRDAGGASKIKNVGGPATTDSLQASAEAIAAVTTPGTSAYKIGPQDVIEISVFKVPELSKAAQVSEAGTVNLPLVGEVIVAGKTAREFEQRLTQQLGAKYLQKPQVTVFVKEYNSQRITVEGAVKRPGVLPIQGTMSLLQAVAMSQGLEETSDDTVLVFRNANGVRQAARFDVSEIRTGSADDPQLLAGDVVVAGTSSLKKNFNGFLKVLPVAGLFALL
jgi:polysaccharide export outer membrane protein